MAGLRSDGRMWAIRATRAERFQTTCSVATGEPPTVRPMLLKLARGTAPQTRGISSTNSGRYKGARSFPRWILLPRSLAASNASATRPGSWFPPRDLTVCAVRSIGRRLVSGPADLPIQERQLVRNLAVTLQFSRTHAVPCIRIHQQVSGDFLGTRDIKNMNHALF